MTFCSASPSTFSTSQHDTSGDVAVSTRSNTKINKHRCDKLAAPSDEESADVEVNDISSGEEGMPASDDERVDHLPPATKKSSQEEAYNLYHLLNHKPQNPYCAACRSSKMKEAEICRIIQNTATTWGQVVAGDRILSTKDNMLGLYVNRGILVIQDAFSGFKFAYPMPDKTADSTMDAIKNFKGAQNIEIFYSDRSGNIDRAPRDLHIFPDKSQLGAPQKNAAVERLAQDVLEGTALLRACLPRCFWECACRRYCAMVNALLARKSVAADGDRSSPWEKAHEDLFLGKLMPIRSTVILKPSETKQDSPSKMEPTAITGVFAGFELALGCKMELHIHGLVS